MLRMVEIPYVLAPFQASGWPHIKGCAVQLAQRFRGISAQNQRTREIISLFGKYELLVFHEVLLKVFPGLGLLPLLTPQYRRAHPE